MKKELAIQDWGLCIGRKVFDPEDHALGLLRGCALDGLLINFYGEEDWSDIKWGYKPVLKTLDQVSEEDFSKIIDIFDIKFSRLTKSLLSKLDNDEILSTIEDEFSKSEIIHLYDYLIQEGIDIRGWIDAGLAIKYDKELHGEWV